MSRIGILGGTFDPIHNGHLYIAENAKLYCKLSKVIFMPSAQSPHKLDKKITSSQHRLEMCQLAVSQEKDFYVSNYEILKEGISYTYNTLRELQEMYHSDKIYFILGADMLKDFRNWYKAEEIIKNFEIIAIARPGFSLQEILDQEFFSTYQERITLIDLIPVSLAASDIRKQFSKGLSIKHLVNLEVYDYISFNDLYKEVK